MTKEKQIEQESVAKEIAEHIPKDANAPKQQETKPATSNQQPATKMEVHKHPHHVMHKKKWGEYLLEFLMLFLAVFLGFVAENIRENGSNREIAKNNIRSFVKNLREDSLNLVRTSQVNEKRFLYLDSLMDLKNSSVSDTVFQQYFVYYYWKLDYDD